MDVSGGAILQGLIVGGLLSTAGVLFKTAMKLAEVSTTVGTHEKRLDKLEASS